MTKRNTDTPSKKAAPTAKRPSARSSTAVKPAPREEMRETLGEAPTEEKPAAEPPPATPAEPASEPPPAEDHDLVLRVPRPKAREKYTTGPARGTEKMYP